MNTPPLKLRCINFIICRNSKVTSRRTYCNKCAKENDARNQKLRNEAVTKINKIIKKSNISMVKFADIFEEKINSGEWKI